MAVIPTRALGSQGMRASAQGLGCMCISKVSFYNASEYDEAGSLATIRRALELGITMLDTAEVYGGEDHENETWIGNAIKGKRDQYVIATKFGSFIKDGAPTLDASPEHIKEAIEGSLQRLQTDYVDLYYLHRKDPKVPIEVTVRAMAELVKEGKVKYLGVSEVSASDLRKAHAIHPITAYQLEWSLWSRDAERDIVPVCRELGIGIVAYSPLGRGFLTGAIKSPADLDDNDFRKTMQPRFMEEAFKKNMGLVGKVKAMAAAKGVTAGQLALAWVHAQGDDVFPIPGTRKVKYLEENAAAMNMKLSAAEIKDLGDVFGFEGAVGDRYNERMQKATYHYGSHEAVAAH